MIMIDSKAGQRLAKTGAALQEAEKAVNEEVKRVAKGQAEFNGGLTHQLNSARFDWMEASRVLTEELIADGHADAEDCS
ncbi:hypothetical protein Q8G38_16130 [Halomonas venusta]|uniref:hypothetical protein n=1 Tax=Vreelandella venusta TaxID=44935 RepID=UPI00295E9E95|nr:hypothetical protein [Halomonas venusta]MDW0360842.1 hypothetical protein [Halomonas venusta]